MRLHTSAPLLKYIVYLFCFEAPRYGQFYLLSHTCVEMNIDKISPESSSLSFTLSFKKSEHQTSDLINMKVNKTAVTG